MMRTWFLMLAAAASVAAIAGPDPQELFFSRVFPVPGQVGLFIAAADGSDERQLLASPDIDYNPAWSPDGAWIVFTSERAGSADLAARVASRRPSNRLRLLRFSVSLCEAVFSAASASSVNSPSAIGVMR